MDSAIADSFLSCPELCAISVVPQVLEGSFVFVVVMAAAAIVLYTLWRKRSFMRRLR